MRCATCGNEALAGKQFCRDHLGGAQAGTARAGDIYATFWQRLGAAIIDGLIVAVGGSVLTAIVAVALGPMFVVLAWLIIYIGYYAGFESSARQATLGKMALGIQVATLEGERIGFGRAVGRLFGKIISSILYIGYLMALFTSHRQTLHDKMASTLMVRKGYSGEEVAEAGPAPPTPGGTIAAVIVLLAFGGIALIGVLAAISIPAYQDYTVRSQVTEGINAAAAYKAAVEEAHAQGKPLAEISTANLQMPQPSLIYVSSIEVQGGVIAVTYGGRANKQISGRTLTIMPATDSKGVIEWVCGHHSPPPGKDIAAPGAADGTTIAKKYLPIKCREG